VSVCIHVVGNTGRQVVQRIRIVSLKIQFTQIENVVLTCNSRTSVLIAASTINSYTQINTHRHSQLHYYRYTVCSIIGSVANCVKSTFTDGLTTYLCLAMLPSTIADVAASTLYYKHSRM